jgi:hypothetical protein
VLFGEARLSRELDDAKRRMRFVVHSFANAGDAA